MLNHLLGRTTAIAQRITALGSVETAFGTVHIGHRGTRNQRHIRQLFAAYARHGQRLAQSQRAEKHRSRSSRSARHTQPLGQVFVRELHFAHGHLPVLGFQETNRGNAVSVG